MCKYYLIYSIFKISVIHLLSTVRYLCPVIHHVLKLYATFTYISSNIGIVLLLCIIYAAQ